jgi:hypothetical protein
MARHAFAVAVAVLALMPAATATAAPSYQELAKSAAAQSRSNPGLASATQLPVSKAAPAGTQRIRYRYGPLDITPGQNWINVGAISASQKPSVDGYITRIRPDLVREDGTVPPSNEVMFHHGVWLNASRQDPTAPQLPERFFAAGEEKTIMTFPKGYGYAVKASDLWLMNDMIHSLIPDRMKLYITYDVDFIPADHPTAANMKSARPIWMDVANGSMYPVFDVKRGWGTKGKFTYPDQATLTPKLRRRGTWKVDRDGVLIGTAGHLHSGGLYNDLFVQRKGKGKKHVFRSKAKYFEPAGPVSWDVSMTASKPNWRVRVKAGDKLQTSVTYETARGSWYESMGIMVTYMADGSGGIDPFGRDAKKISTSGPLTHGHLRENENHGGPNPALMSDPRKLPGSVFASGGTLEIDDFSYGQGDLRASGTLERPPVIKPGGTLRFKNLEGSVTERIYHTITSCQAPCNGIAGIAYPIPNGPVEFDSGQLGYGPPNMTAAINDDTWTAPKDLDSGTYTYFCRIHPFMRGSFRVDE